MEVNLEWKEKNKVYLNAIEIFLDKASNIENENLKKEIVGSALRCDKILTEIAIKEINRNKK